MNLESREGTEITKIIDRVIFLVVQNNIEDDPTRELRCFDSAQCGFQLTLFDDDHRRDGSIPHLHIETIPGPFSQEHFVVAEANKTTP